MIALKIKYDPEEGEATDIVELPAFKRENLLFKADVLRDAAYMVTKQYEAAAEAWLLSLGGEPSTRHIVARIVGHHIEREHERE